jgi:hypothetical protein
MGVFIAFSLSGQMSDCSRKAGMWLRDVDSTRLHAAECVPAMEQVLKWENFTLPIRLSFSTLRVEYGIFKEKFSNELSCPKNNIARFVIPPQKAKTLIDLVITYEKGDKIAKVTCLSPRSIVSARIKCSFNFFNG